MQGLFQEDGWWEGSCSTLGVLVALHHLLERGKTAFQMTLIFFLNSPSSSYSSTFLGHFFSMPLLSIFSVETLPILQHPLVLEGPESESQPYILITASPD